MSDDNKNNKTNYATKTSREQQRFIHEQALLVEANRLLVIRLRLAAAFQGMWIKAYDALLHHQVNVRALPEYKDSRLLDQALESGDIGESESTIVEYLKRVHSAIDAAVRRKSFRKV